MIHAHNMVHLDVKPENIYVTPDRDCPGKYVYKIGDFGLIAAADAGKYFEVRALSGYLTFSPCIYIYIYIYLCAYLPHVAIIRRVTVGTCHVSFSTTRSASQPRQTSSHSPSACMSWPRVGPSLCAGTNGSSCVTASSVPCQRDSRRASSSCSRPW